MRLLQKKIMDATSLAASVNSSPMAVEHMLTFSVQAVWTGTPTGAFKIQVSNDIGQDVAGTSVSNWTDLPSGMFTAGGSAPAGAAGNYTIHSRDLVNYKWIRLVYTASSGTGSCTAIVVGKGYTF